MNIMEHFRVVDLKCILDWKESKDTINKEFGGSPETETYFNAEIRYNYIKPAPLEFYIYYPQDNFLFEKFEFLKNMSKNILSYIQISPDTFGISINEILDFSKSEVIDLYEGHTEWKHGKKPVIIRIKNLIHYTNNSRNHAGIFYLTENGSYLIEGLSKNWRVIEDEIYFSNKAVEIEKYNNTYDWGPMSFGIGFKYDIKDYNRHTISIERLPFLQIDAPSKYSDSQIEDYANDVCLMMSLFWSKYINYFWGIIRVTQNQPEPKFREKTVYKFVEDQIDDNIYTRWGDKFKNIIDFFNTIDYDKVAVCRDLLKEVSNRMIRSQYVDSISEFMLLYNVIEKIRNYYLNLGKQDVGFSIKEEYDFNVSKNRTDKFIKEKIKEIAEIVADNDKEEFVKNANKKVSFIRKTGLIDQFTSLILYLDLSVDAYKIDFSDLINIRNTLYHGNCIDDDFQLYNTEMRRLINDLLLKLLS